MTDPNITPATRVARILAAAEGYRVAECDQLVAAAREALAPTIFVRDVCSPALREAGDRWERGVFSVAQEHLLTSAVRRQLTCALDVYNRSASPPALAFTTLSGERHEMGSLMLAVIAASRGAQTIYLGPDLPVAEVGRFCSHVPVAAVAISIVTSPVVIDALHQLRELRAALPSDLPIWLGGQASAHLNHRTLPANCLLISGLASFERLTAGLKARGEH